MKCQRCGKKDSIMKITQIKDGEISEFHVCDECSMMISTYQAKLSQKKNPEISLLLQQLIQPGGKPIKTTGEIRIVAQTVPPCSTCGYEFPKYKATLMLGCPDCYKNFGEHLMKDIEKIQGSTHHVGSSPNLDSSVFQRQERLRLFRAELEECVENEDYERAAYLRDEIKKLTEKDKKNGASEKDSN